MRTLTCLAVVLLVGCGSGGTPGGDDDAGAESDAGSGADAGGLALGLYAITWTCETAPCDYQFGTAADPPGVLAGIQARIAEDAAHDLHLRFDKPDGGFQVSTLFAFDGGYRADGFLTSGYWDDFVIYPTADGFELTQVYDDGDGTPETLHLEATRI